MLTAIPRSIFSWSFTVYDRGEPVTDVDVSWVRERGSFRLAGHTFEVLRTSMLHGEFALQSNGLVLATAKKISPFLRAFEVQCEGRTYSLRALHPFTRRFSLYENSRQIGSVRPLHPFSRKAHIDLPKELVPPVQVFLFWLVMILWRRAAGGSSGAAGS